VRGEEGEARRAAWRLFNAAKNAAKGKKNVGSLPLRDGAA
jgi:hypothetical protein